MRSDVVVQRGLRTHTRPFFARFSIGIIPGLVAAFAFMVPSKGEARDYPKKWERAWHSNADGRWSQGRLRDIRVGVAMSALSGGSPDHTAANARAKVGRVAAERPAW